MKTQKTVTLIGLIFTLGFLFISPLAITADPECNDVPDGVRRMVKTLEGSSRESSDHDEALAIVISA